MKGPLFYSKILLFGEYGIIKDSKGLSIPYNFYNGALKMDDNTSEEALNSNKNLKNFVAYLTNLDIQLVAFDIDMRDIEIVHIHPVDQVLLGKYYFEEVLLILELKKFLPFS